MDTKTVRRVKIAGALLVGWCVFLAVMPGLTHNHDAPAAPFATQSTVVSPPRAVASVPPQRNTGRASKAKPPVPVTAESSAEVSEAAPETKLPALAQTSLSQPLLPSAVMALLSRSPMIDILGDTRINDACPWGEKESGSNVAFMKAFAPIFRDAFPASKGGAPDGSGLHWFLDEGGLIGSSRAGSMANADDDFDFFVLLPNQHAPCRPDSITCTAEEFEEYIHRFLMVFWERGMCINKFPPKRDKFKSRRRLMYSFQLNRNPDLPPERCFQEGKPFAHMHLGMFTPEGRIKTNIWAHGTTHPMDELDLGIMLPVTRCRAGPVDAPCPHNITKFLTVRNRGEYRSGGDGSCLLVRKKWGAARKKAAVQRTLDLSRCGYNTMGDLVPEFIASDYRTC